MRPKAEFSGPRPVVLTNSRARTLRVVSPPAAELSLPLNVLRIVLLPYLACRTKGKEHVKTTMPLTTDMHNPQKTAFPIYEVQLLEDQPEPTYHFLRSLTEELVTHQLGPFAKHPIRLFADRLYTYHELDRTLVVTLIVPFPTQKSCPEGAFDTFTRKVTAWATDPDYCASMAQTRTVDFATLIDFLLGIVRPWHYNQILPHAVYFWSLVLPGQLPASARWAMLAFLAPYFRNTVRWQWKEARPYLGAFAQVILNSRTRDLREEYHRRSVPSEAVIIPFIPDSAPSCGWGGFTGIARSVLISAHTPATELRALRSDLSMSWTTWLSLWQNARLNSKALLLCPHPDHKPDADGLHRSTIHGYIRADTTPGGQVDTKRRSLYSAGTRPLWEENMTLIDGCPASVPDWKTILPRLEAYTYTPTPEIDSPALHAPFSDANLRAPTPQYNLNHPQPIVSERAQKRYPRTVAEAQPRNESGDEEERTVRENCGPATASDSDESEEDFVPVPSYGPKITPDRHVLRGG